MKKIDADSIVSVSSEQISAEVSGAAVLLHVANGMYYSLNEVGTYVWNLIEKQSRAVPELVDAVMSEYAVDRARCEADVIKLLEELEERGLITVADRAS